jgi:Rap1a immunity proteins
MLAAAVSRFRPNLPTFFCEPDDTITNGQALRVVVKFLRAHPELLHLPEVVLVVRAFSEAFPCKTRG